MKKFTFIFLLSIFFLPFIFSQNEFGAVGSHWNYEYQSHNGNGGGWKVISVEKDTIIDNELFKVLHMSSYTYESIPFYETYESYTLGLMSIRNDSVFFTGGFLYDNELILDFGMEEGDSLELNDPSVSGALNLVVDSIQMIEIDGVEYKHSFGKKTCTMNSYYEEDFQMIEGIGNVRDFFLWNTDGCVIGGGVNYFRCYRNGDFTYPIDQPCDDLSNTEDILKKQRVNIFPNPFKDNLSLEASEKIKHLQLFDMQGNLIFEEKNVFDSRELSFSFLTHGVYFLKIQFEKNTFVQKLIKI